MTLQRGGENVSLHVQDDVGLVTEAVAGTSDMPNPLPSAPALWNPNGDLTHMTVYWESTACSTHPSIHISGNALVLSIDLGPASGTCDATEVPNFVTFKLDRVIDVSAVTLHMAAAPGT